MKRSVTGFMAAMGLLVAAPALADITTSSFLVSVEVRTPTSCSVFTFGSINFGLLDPNVVVPGLIADTAVAVRCTAGADFDLYPSWGDNQSGLLRRVRNGAGQYLGYELFMDPGHTAFWDPDMFFNRKHLIGTGFDEIHGVYGRLITPNAPVNDGSMDGTYMDVVAMTIEYTP